MAKFNSVQGRTQKADDNSLKHMKYQKLMNDASVTMKKLQVSLFKNNFKKSLVTSLGEGIQNSSILENSTSGAGIFDN